MGRQAKESARDVKDRAVQSATQTAEEVGRQAASYAADQKERMADEVETLGRAFECAADTLREEQDERVAQYASMAADRLRSTSDYLRSRDMGELVADVESFARRRPEIFFGGMLLVGLGLARLLKASRRERTWEERPSLERQEYDDDYGYEHFAAQSSPERSSRQYAPQTGNQGSASEELSQAAGGNDPLSYH